MKLLQILSLVGLCLLFTPARPAAVDTTSQNENGAGVRGRLRWGRPATGREHNPNPRNLLPWQLLREREQARGERLVSHPPSALVPGVDPRIVNPVFSIAPTYASGGKFSVAAVAGDFNGDGKPDLAVVNDCLSSSNCTIGSVGILLNKGDGTFKLGAKYSSRGYFPNSVVAGDFNGDGRLDVALAECSDASCTNGVVSVLLGNGDGTFQAAVTYPAGESSGFITDGDVNGDGKMDLVVVNGQSSIGVLAGNGDGTFQAAVSFSSGEKIAGPIALADFNHDGRLDLAEVDDDCRSGAAPDPCTSRVRILLGNGNGTFQPASRSYASTGRSAQSVVVGDFNGDGKLDLRGA